MTRAGRRPGPAGGRPLQGLENSSKSRPLAAIPLWTGPLGLNAVALWDLVVNWDPTTRKARKNHRREFLPRGARRAHAASLRGDREG